MSWIQSNLENALNTWNGKLTEIYDLVVTHPMDFRGGSIWKVIMNINGAMQAIGLALLVLFFVIGVMKTCGSLTEVKKPEHALRLFIRFAIAKIVVTHGLEIMNAILNIGYGITMQGMTKSSLLNSPTSLPGSIVDAINNLGFFEQIPLWAVTLLGSLFITVLSFILILTVYGRFFKIYMYMALSPIPLSSFAGQPSDQIGKSFIKSFAGVCLEGAVIILSCVIFSVFASSGPSVDTGAEAVTMVWKYVGELIFNMLVLVGTVRMSDRIVKEMMGL